MFEKWFIELCTLQMGDNIDESTSSTGDNTRFKWYAHVNRTKLLWLNPHPLAHARYLCVAKSALK